MASGSKQIRRRGYHHGNLREALLLAARRLIAERGPAGFTLVEASRMAGVSPAAPYRHFKDRDALVAEVRRRGFEEFGRRLAAAWTGAGQGARAAFTRMGEAYLAFAREEPGYYSAMFAPGPASRGMGVGRAGQDAFATLNAAVARAAAGERKGRDLRLAAYQIWALSHGIATLAAAGHITRVEPGRLLRSGVAALMGESEADRGEPRGRAARRSPARSKAARKAAR